MDDPQHSLPKPNYLTRLAAEQEKRRWVRRKCNILVGLLCTRKGMRRISLGQIRLLDVCEGGALMSTHTPDVPDHFYIYFGTFQYFIGCTVVGRRDGHLHVRFIREQPTDFVDVLGRIADPFEFRGEIRPALYAMPVPDPPAARSVAADAPAE